LYVGAINRTKWLERFSQCFCQQPVNTYPKVGTEVGQWNFNIGSLFEGGCVLKVRPVGDKFGHPQ